MNEVQEQVKPETRSITTLMLSVFVFMFLGLGTVAPLVGLALIVIHSVIPEDRILADIGTVLMIVSIPMLLLGSHFMDLVDKRK